MEVACPAARCGGRPELVRGLYPLTSCIAVVLGMKPEAVKLLGPPLRGGSLSAGVPAYRARALCPGAGDSDVLVLAGLPCRLGGRPADAARPPSRLGLYHDQWELRNDRSVALTSPVRRVSPGPEPPPRQPAPRQRRPGAKEWEDVQGTYRRHLSRRRAPSFTGHTPPARQTIVDDGVQRPSPFAVTEKLASFLFIHLNPRLHSSIEFPRPAAHRGKTSIKTSKHLDCLFRPKKRPIFTCLSPRRPDSPAPHAATN